MRKVSKKMNKLDAKKIIDKIKKEKIIPDKKWKVVFKNYFFWGILALAVLFAGIFFSMVLLDFFVLDFTLLRVLKFQRFVKFLFFATPYVWIFLLVIALILGYLAVKHTKRGYRHSFFFLVGLLIPTTLLLGFLANFYHLNKTFEQKISRDLPRFHEMNSRDGRFFMPQEGLVFGKVLAIRSGEFDLQGPRKQVLFVRYSEKTKIQGVLASGVKVFVVGERFDRDKFRAFEVRVVDDENFRPCKTFGKGADLMDYKIIH